ncbi:MAG: hypothetical protein ACXWIT_24345 [Burkholderiales bacterium]
MRTLCLVLVVVTNVWTALACAAESTERTYADPACSARDVSPERCVLQDGNARRIVVGAQNAPSADARGATPTTAGPAASSTGAGQAATSTAGARK